MVGYGEGENKKRGGYAPSLRLSTAASPVKDF